ncbi:MAG: hypothetical protein HRT69_10670 [Flavobacteriaceae bacterium]|nr:hypothetical protein [Flavobacteriaceae bacterium]
MKNLGLCIILMLIGLSSMSQEMNKKVKRKVKMPFWVTHVEDTDILGVSFSFFPSNYSDNMGGNRTFGIRIEPTPISLLEFMFGRPLLSRTEEIYDSKLGLPANQQVYGFNFSTGTSEDIDLYGVSVIGLSQYYHRANGLMLAGVNQIEKANGLIVGVGGNGVYRGNGVMLASVWGNEANYFNGVQVSAFNAILKKGTGVQIGLWNSAKNFRGIQIGFWNKNDKRSLPIINWNFKS